METPQPPQISVSGRIVIEGQLSDPSSVVPQIAPTHPSPQWWKSPINLFTLALVIFAGIQTWIFSQSDTSFVFPYNAEFKEPLIVGEKYLSIYLDISNSGKYAANITELRAAITHGPLPAKRAYPDSAKFAIPPIPGNGKITQTLRFPTEWPQTKIEDLHSGRLVLYLFGVFTYGDLYKPFNFWGDKKSGFCFIYAPDASTANKGVFRTCRELQYTYTK